MTAISNANGTRADRILALNRNGPSARMVILILCLILLGVGSALYTSISAGREARAQVVLTTEVLRHLRTSMRMGLNAETGQRGFLLTADETYLEDYTRGSQEWIASIAALELTLDGIATPEQTSDIARLHELAEAKLAELSRTIDLARADRQTEALDLVLTDEGKELMDEFRTVISRLEDEEQVLLNKAVVRAERIEARTLPILGLLLIAILVLVGFGLLSERKAARAEARAQDADELRQSRKRAELLTRELNHRVKNLFSVILSIASISRRNAAPEASAALDALHQRIHALARAHAVTQGHLEHETLSLRDLLDATLAPYADEGSSGARIHLEGPHVDIAVKTITPLGLMLHELATNAVKYGGLKEPGGKVAVEWTLGSDGDAEHPSILDLTWRETGGRAVAPATQKGFGSLMMQQAARQLRGTFQTDWKNVGLTAHLRMELSSPQKS